MSPDRLRRESSLVVHRQSDSPDSHRDEDRRSLPQQRPPSRNPSLPLLAPTRHNSESPSSAISGTSNCLAQFTRRLVNNIPELFVVNCDPSPPSPRELPLPLPHHHAPRRDVNQASLRNTEEQNIILAATSLALLSGEGLHCFPPKLFLAEITSEGKLADTSP